LKYKVNKPKVYFR